MKTTIDKTTMFKLFGNLTKMFEPDISNFTLPEFENKEGHWVHDNQHSITVVKDDNELKLHTSKPDWPKLLGIYKIEASNEGGKLILFPDAIKEESKRYSDKKSIQEGADSRGSHDSWGGDAKPNGLFESDSFIYVEILCKIELILLNIIHNRFGVWESDFYSEKNIVKIDILVMQLTKEVIKDYDELVDCFEWLNINWINDSEFVFNTPVTFVKNISGIKEQEWTIINSLDIFINCFPIKDKISTETWESFLNRTSRDAQDCFVERANKLEHGWKMIINYITPENRIKYRGSIHGQEFGL